MASLQNKRFFESISNHPIDERNPQRLEPGPMDGSTVRDPQCTVCPRTNGLVPPILGQSLLPVFHTCGTMPDQSRVDRAECLCYQGMPRLTGLPEDSI